MSAGSKDKRAFYPLVQEQRRMQDFYKTKKQHDYEQELIRLTLAAEQKYKAAKRRKSRLQSAREKSMKYWPERARRSRRKREQAQWSRPEVNRSGWDYESAREAMELPEEIFDYPEPPILNKRSFTDID